VTRYKITSAVIAAMTEQGGSAGSFIQFMWGEDRLKSYLDTLVLVSALTKEIRIADVQAWIAHHGPGDLAAGPWVVTAFSAAYRSRSDLVSPGWNIEQLPCQPSSGLCRSRSTCWWFPTGIITSRSFADQAPLGLCAGDALNLAIAIKAGLSIATLDRKLAEAGLALSVPMELL
jgi:uncharacterized protein